MIDLPIKAQVLCSDGPAGRSTYVIGHPVTHQLTHLVVKSYLPPFHEHIVPVDQVDEATPDQIKLKCIRKELNKMEPFEYEEYIQSELPGYLVLPDVPAIPGYTMEPVDTFISVKHQNIPPGELALHRGARVEAIDGYVGKVDGLLINSNNKQVTHLVLQERHILVEREIAIPVSQIDHIYEDTVYLKLDRQGVEELPETPIQDWRQDEHGKMSF
jgi:hypothetical protein